MFAVYAKEANLEDPLASVVVGEQPDPIVKDGWVRVKVTHASLNRHDRIIGVRDIVAADYSASRRRVAEAMGATLVVDPATISPYDSWAAIAYPQGYRPGSLDAFLKIGRQPRPSVIFECVGVPGMLQAVFEGALTGTRIVVVGVCMEPDRFEPLFPLNKENDVIFCFYYSAEEYSRSLHHIAEGLIDVAPLLSRTVGLNEAVNAFTALESGAEDIKIIVDPWK